MSNVHYLGYEIEEERTPAPAFSGGPPTGGDMSIIDAKIAASEARTDTKFAQVLARLDNIDERTKGLKANIWLATATAIGLVFAALAFGVGQFGNGVMVTTATIQDSVQARKIAEDNAAEVRALREDFGTLNQKLDGIYKAIEASRTPPQQ